MAHQTVAVNSMINTVLNAEVIKDIYFKAVFMSPPTLLGKCKQRSPSCRDLLPD